VPGVDLAHAVRVWQDVRVSAAPMSGMKARAGSGGAHSPSTRATSSEGLLKPCRCPRGATNIEPGGPAPGLPEVAELATLPMRGSDGR